MGVEHVTVPAGCQRVTTLLQLPWLVLPDSTNPSMSVHHERRACAGACRLSEILSVLGRLMAPLVSALSGNEALVTLSIRTLEYWVDSLNPEFLEPAMLPVIPQLMRALWSHLRPLPYNFSAKVQPRSIIQSIR